MEVSEVMMMMTMARTMLGDADVDHADYVGGEGC